MVSLNVPTVRSNLHLAIELARQTLAIDLSRSKLGWAWWFMDPLFTIGIMWFFKVLVFGVDRYQPYIIFVGCAIICWKFISATINRSANLLRQREGLIKSFPFPTIVLPCSMVITQLLFYLTGLMVLIALAVAIGQPITLMFFQVFPLVTLMALMTFGIGLLVSVAGVFFQDLGNFTSHVLRILWFVSPGIYSADLVEERFGANAQIAELYRLSPIAILFEGFRDTIFEPAWIPFLHWFVLAVFCFGFLAAGLTVYQRYDRRLIKYF